MRLAASDLAARSAGGWADRATVLMWPSTHGEFGTGDGWLRLGDGRGDRRQRLGSTARSCAHATTRIAPSSGPPSEDVAWSATAARSGPGGSRAGEAAPAAVAQRGDNSCPAHRRRGQRWRQTPAALLLLGVLAFYAPRAALANDMFVVGYNDYGQLGVGDYLERSTQTFMGHDKLPLESIRGIGAGLYHNLVLGDSVAPRAPLSPPPRDQRWREHGDTGSFVPCFSHRVPVPLKRSPQRWGGSRIYLVEGVGMLSSGIFARSVLALAFIPVTSMTCGTTSWVDGCSELRFGDHSLRIQQLNVRMGGARSHRPWWKEEEQLRDTIDGTGGVVWGSARILCEYLVANPELVNGKRVLELGSGTGMTALLCKALGAAAVTATDVRDQLALINVNLQLNPSLEIRVVPLQWGAQGDIQAQFQPYSSSIVTVLPF